MRRTHLRDLPPIAGAPPMARLGPDDDGALARLMAAAFDDPTWDTAKVREALLEAPDVDTTFGVYEDGALAATASARHLADQPQTGYVHWVGTDPAFAGRRLGWWASLAVLHRFVELGKTDAVLHTDDFRLPAVKTYLNLGFLPEIVDPEQPERWRKVCAALGVALPTFLGAVAQDDGDRIEGQE
jgi:mycothiol synthase